MKLLAPPAIPTEIPARKYSFSSFLGEMRRQSFIGKQEAIGKYFWVCGAKVAEWRALRAKKPERKIAWHLLEAERYSRAAKLAETEDDEGGLMAREGAALGKAGNGGEESAAYFVAAHKFNCFKEEMKKIALLARAAETNELCGDYGKSLQDWDIAIKVARMSESKLEAVRGDPQFADYVKILSAAVSLIPILHSRAALAASRCGRRATAVSEYYEAANASGSPEDKLGYLRMGIREALASEELDVWGWLLGYCPILDMCKAAIKLARGEGKIEFYLMQAEAQKQLGMHYEARESFEAAVELAAGRKGQIGR